MKEMNISFELNPPMMPNYLSLKMPVSSRQEGLKSQQIDVGELTHQQAEEYAELMKSTFLKHWEKRQSAPIPGPVMRDLK